MTDDELSAARRYKQILAEVTDAAAALRERDRRRAADIEQRLLPALREAMLRAGDRARLTTSVIQLHWEAALDLLWAESWLKLRTYPSPDPSVDPSELEALDAEVKRSSDELHALVRRRWYHLLSR